MRPDWLEYVRSHLPPLGLRAEREIEIQGELAGQLEEAYQEALHAGDSDSGTSSRSHSPFQLELKRDGTFALLYHQVPLVAAGFKF